MECRQNRLESFSKPVRLQNASKTGAWKNIKWPHPDSFAANPTSLADAGFYYDPSFDERDSVTCFACDKEIADWDADDDPFDIHWTKCSKICSWAIVRCGLKQDLDGSGRFIFPDKNRLPTSKAMEKARLQTYSVGGGWIHDKTKNHGASSKKMAKAGFVFTPQHADDDAVTCLYCGISLDAWDTDDDPLEEHRKRKSAGCAFFSGSSPPTSTSTTTKSRSASSSKPNSRTSTAPTRSASTRGRSRSAMQDIIEDTTEPLAPPAKSTTTRKPSRAAKKSVVPINEDDEDEDDKETQDEVRAGRSKKTEKPRSRSTSKSVPRKPSSRVRKVAPVKEESDEQEAGGSDYDKRQMEQVALKPSRTVKPELELDDTPTTTVAKSAGTSKKGSRSRKTTTAPVEVEEEEEADKGRTLGKSTLSRKGSTKSKPKKSTISPPSEEYETAPEPEPEVAEEEEKVALGKSTLSRKTSRSKKLATPVEDEESVNEEQVALGKSTLSKKPSRSKKIVPAVEDENAQVGVVVPLRKSTLLKKSSRSKKPTPPSEDDEPEAVEEQPTLGKSTLSKKPSNKFASSSQFTVEDEDDEEDQPARHTRKTKPRPKHATRKTAPSPVPAEPTPYPFDEHEETEELVIPKKSKKETVKRPERVKRDGVEEEMEELVIPKKRSKPTLTTSTKKAKPGVKTFHEEHITTEEEHEDKEEEDTPPPKKSAAVKARTKTVESTAEEGDGERTSSPQPQISKKVAKPKSVTKSPPVVEQEDVEMEDISVIKKPASGKRVKKARSRSPPPSKPTTKPKSKTVVSESEPESEDEVQANLVEAIHVSDTEMEEAPEPEPEPLSFAPRLVVKTTQQEQERAKTPELMPIIVEGMLPIIRPEPEPEQQQEVINEPKTPGRNPALEAAPVQFPVDTITTTNSSSESQSQQEPEENQPPFMPFLSKLPFTPLVSLSDAELDMTVEEWIRYQMEVEFDKFKRDGERELVRFRKRAEEVRKVIEGL